MLPTDITTISERRANTLTETVPDLHIVFKLYGVAGFSDVAFLSGSSLTVYVVIVLREMYHCRLLNVHTKYN